MNKLDWMIHCSANGIPCAICGKREAGFLEHLCDFHTSGMSRYNHTEFQMVLRYADQEIGRILNDLGLRVQAGERFKDGDLVSGIYEDCQIRLAEIEDDGKTFLRVIVPDKNNRFPEHPECEYPYMMQQYPTVMFHRNGGCVQ